MDALPTDFVEELQALWEARNSTMLTSTPSRTPDGEKVERTFAEKQAIAARVRARHAAAKQRLLH